MNEQNEFIKNYLHTEYVGCLKTDHEKCIDLQYEEIGNFVQNAGMFGDLEISIKHNGLVLFDTNGIYNFCRIWDVSLKIQNIPEIILWNLSILLLCNFKVILMMEI